MKKIFYDIEININFNEEESEKHIDGDLKVLQEADFNKIVIEKFIPWIKGNDFLDRDDQKIFEGLELYEIVYTYGKIVAKYSPTKEDAYFGQFEFSFQSSNEYTEDMLEAVAMEIYILDGKIVKVSGYDI